MRRPELRPFAELWRCWLRNEDCGKQELDQLSDSGPAREAIATREVFAVMYHKVAEPTPRKAKQRGPSIEDKRGWAPLATQVAKLTLLVPPSTLHLRRCDMQLDIVKNLCLQSLLGCVHPRFLTFLDGKKLIDHNREQVQNTKEVRTHVAEAADIIHLGHRTQEWFDDLRLDDVVLMQRAGHIAEKDACQTMCLAPILLRRSDKTSVGCRCVSTKMHDADVCITNELLSTRCVHLSNWRIEQGIRQGFSRRGHERNIRSAQVGRVAPHFPSRGLRVNNIELRSRHAHVPRGAALCCAKRARKLQCQEPRGFVPRQVPHSCCQRHAT